MFVHFSPEIETVRVYLEGNEDSYAERKPYDAVATIKYLNDGTAEISAALGKYPIKVSRVIEKHCRDRGVKKVRWEHKHRNITYDITSSNSRD